MGSLTKGYLGKEDMYVQTNTSASETFNRLSSTGSTVSITKVPDIWAGTGKVEVAECETDVLSNDSSLSVKIGGTEFITVDSSGNTDIKINDNSITGNEGLRITNLNATTGYGGSLVLANHDEELGLTYFTNGNLIARYTFDAWATSATSFTISPFESFSLYQVHSSSDGSVTGAIKEWVFQDDDMSDDATLSLPTGVQGICMANAYGNAVHAVGMWSVLTDGTVLLIAGTQYDDADTDGNLCLYDDGSGAVLKQRLGGAAKVRVIFHYY